MATLYLAADHAGWKLKEAIKPKLTTLGVTIRDLSPTFEPGDDYPPIGKSLATVVAKDKRSRGILFCGSGVGMAIAANRIQGTRAVEAMNIQQIKLARQHNDVNVLALGGWDQSPQAALALINTFLNTKTSTATRHQRRIKQLG